MLKNTIALFMICFLSLLTSTMHISQAQESDIFSKDESDAVFDDIIKNKYFTTEKFDMYKNFLE